MRAGRHGNSQDSHVQRTLDTFTKNNLSRAHLENSIQNSRAFGKRLSSNTVQKPTGGANGAKLCLPDVHKKPKVSRIIQNISQTQATVGAKSHSRNPSRHENGGSATLVTSARRNSQKNKP